MKTTTTTEPTAGPLEMPWLLPGRIARLEGRGEVFYRHHVHPDRSARTVLLLHGWTASADTQFFTAYEALAEHFSVIAVDHRGHGRGIRATFSLEAVADDAAALLRHLGEREVIVVGYSMGGPITMLLTRRHAELVGGIVLQATALEWQATRRDRVSWRALGVMGLWIRSRWFERVLDLQLTRLFKERPDMRRWQPWLTGEVSRNDPHAVIAAGRALSRYDARPWASTLGVPAAMLVTTKDRLVRPAKQRELAKAVDATVRELAADHLCALTDIEEFSAATVDLVTRIATATTPA